MLHQGARITTDCFKEARVAVELRRIVAYPQQVAPMIARAPAKLCLKTGGAHEGLAVSKVLNERAKGGVDTRQEAGQRLPREGVVGVDVVHRVRERRCWRLDHEPICDGEVAYIHIAEEVRVPVLGVVE